MPYDHKTSGVAYHDTTEKSRDYCRQQVLIAIRKLKVCNDRQIAEYLGPEAWPINRITPRRGELVTMGVVVLDRKAKDPVTNRTVSYWKEKTIPYQPSLFN